MFVPMNGVIGSQVVELAGKINMYLELQETLTCELTYRIGVTDNCEIRYRVHGRSDENIPFRNWNDILSVLLGEYTMIRAKCFVLLGMESM